MLRIGPHHLHNFGEADECWSSETKDGNLWVSDPGGGMDDDNPRGWEYDSSALDDEGLTNGRIVASFHGFLSRLTFLGRSPPPRWLLRRTADACIRTDVGWCHHAWGGPVALRFERSEERNKERGGVQVDVWRFSWSAHCTDPQLAIVTAEMEHAGHTLTCSELERLVGVDLSGHTFAYASVNQPPDYRFGSPTAVGDTVDLVFDTNDGESTGWTVDIPRVRAAVTASRSA